VQVMVAKRGWSEAGVRGELAPVLLICLLWAACWCLSVPAGDIPLNDDWSYALAVKSILETGRFTLIPWSTANVLVQAYWGALFCLPFGFSYEALRLSTFVLATACVVAAYFLFRELGAERPAATLGTLTLALNPLFLQLSTTFMTDIPFTALVVIALWLYVRGANRDAAGPIVAAYGVGILAVLIRQFGVVLPVAFGVAHLVRKDVSWRSLLVAVVPVLLFAAVHLGFQRWMIATGRSSGFTAAVGNLLAVSPGAAWWRAKHLVLLMLPCAGLFTLPCAIYALAGDRLALRAKTPLLLGVLFAGLVYAVVLADGAALPHFGSSLQPFGLGPLTLSDTYLRGINTPFVPGAAAVWAVLTVLSCGAVAVVGAAVLRIALQFAREVRRSDRWGRHWPAALMLSLVACYMAALLALGSFTYVFDRYLVVVVLPLCVLLFLGFPSGEARPGMVAGAGVAVACFAVFSVLATHDWLAWNRARWQAASYLAGQGVPPEKIDGGYEFNGTYLYRPGFRPEGGRSWWWVEDDEYLIASGPVPGYQALQSFDFPHWLWPDDYHVLVLRRSGA
jgi:4-amino-4-deoxy-L-arabinose transferase-like glycosyltransferase